VTPGGSTNGTASYVGTVRMLTCNVGYTLQGDGIIRCGEDGLWHVTSTCTLIGMRFQLQLLILISYIQWSVYLWYERICVSVKKLTEHCRPIRTNLNCKMRLFIGAIVCYSSHCFCLIQTINFHEHLPKYRVRDVECGPRCSERHKSYVWNCSPGHLWRVFQSARGRHCAM